jgi:NTE family protein
MFYKIKFILAFVTLLSLPSCHKSHYQFNEYPDRIPEIVFEKREIGVALVLGGGGARGMFHVGVIEVLQEAKIPIDLIVGCSAGAVVGALYADNPDGLRVKECLIPLKRKDLLEINIFSCRYGLCKGKALKQFLNDNLCAKNFEDLKIPFLAVATDLEAGEVVNLGSGPIIPAVHASCAVPFFFEPVKLYGRILVDGGVLDPNPVAAAKLYSPKMIIAVDLAELLPVTHPTSLFGIATRSAEIIHLNQSRTCLNGANVIIRPSLNPIGMFDDTHTQALYEDGKRAAREVLSEIQDFYEKHVCTHQP